MQGASEPSGPILIGLGASLTSQAGDPPATLVAALEALEAGGVRVRAHSRLYRTPAWPDPADPPFANAAAAVTTPLAPAPLLALLHQIEDRFGRARPYPNAPRTLDLDLLAYGAVVATDPLHPPLLPHPRLHLRGFVLRPLADIAAGWVHPLEQRNIAALLTALPGDALAGIAPLDWPA